MNSNVVFDEIWNWGTTALLAIIFVRMLGWVVIESYIELKDRWETRNIPSDPPVIGKDEE